jgi:2-oxoisovalerate dehydrogenase E1 component
MTQTQGEQYRKLYETMVLAQTINKKLHERRARGAFPFYVGSSGHEASAAVVGALDDGDWLALYYRDLAGWLERTGDVKGVLRAAYSRVTDPMSSGRNMPAHYSSRQYHILPTFSEVAGLAPFAAGVGWACKRDGTRRILAFFTGDGGVATNDFNVLLRAATVHKLPVLMVVWNNHWAIMTEAQTQWAGDLCAQVRAMDAIAMDANGVDPIETYEATRSLAERVRNGEGPALLHLHMGLLESHTSNVDMRRYRPKEEIETTMRTKDPVERMEQLLLQHGTLRNDEIEQIHASALECFEQAEREVESEPVVPGERVLERVFAPATCQPEPETGPSQPRRMIDAINDALVEIVRRDPGFFVFGQDVGSPTGGVNRATERLVKEYHGTAISSALNEQLIAGIAAGCSMADGRPRCGEIQFVDYHQSATQTIRLAARVYYQSYGDWTCPMLLRTRAGSGGGGPISESKGGGGGAFGHSNAGEQWFTGVPGLITLCPSTPYDAKGLLIEASHSQSPVVFLERGRLYRANPPHIYPDGALIDALAEFWNVPEGYYAEPLGKARTLRIGEGASVATIVSWGTMLLESAIAAARFADAHEGTLVEVIDLRTLMPFDEEAVRQSVARTNRVIVATEEVDITSFGRHLHSWITQHLFWDLDNPAILLSAVAAPAAPYNEEEESKFFPKADDIQRALEQLACE